MLKTNSKKAKENLKKYIMVKSESAFQFDKSYYSKNISGEFFPYKDNDFNHRAAYIWEKFKAEKQHTYKQSYFNFYNFEVFKDWGQGLACNQLFTFLLHTAVDDLGAILEENEQEKTKFSEDQASEKMFCLMYREIKNGYERYLREA